MMITLLLASAALQGPAPRPFSVNDMLAMDRVSDLVLSADGQWALYNLRSTDLEKNRGTSDVWMVPTAGGEPRRLTSMPGSESGARFAHDGKSVLFLSAQSGSSQVWSVGLDGGEPKQLTQEPLGVESFQPFPGDARLLLAMEVWHEYTGPDAVQKSLQKDADIAARKASGRLYDSLLFRHWDSWEDGKRSHIFVWQAGAATYDLVSGFDGDVPTKPFGGMEEVTIKPNGAEVVFASLLYTGDAAWAYNTELYHVRLEAPGALANITEGNPAWDGNPSYSPDGTQLAYLRMRRPGYESDRRAISVVNAKTFTGRELTVDWDRSPDEIVWSRDGKTLWCTADDLGNKSIFAVDVATGAVRRVLGKGTNAAPREAQGKLVYLHDNLKAPVEVYSAGLDGKDARALTQHNAKQLAATRMGDFEQFQFLGYRNEPVYGFLVKPVNFDPKQKYPVAFLIHGGPQGSFGDHFHYRWNPQAYAGAGYAAIMIDFHGSTGYGQTFTDTINGDWGGAPYIDLMKGLDAALEQYTFLDKDRCVALGASYGGYMINWINGQTDRFRALVCHAGNIDERLAYYDTEELWFPEWERGGTPWEVPESYAHHNPIDHVHKWATPTLVIHGANDFRVVDTQGMSTFTALQRRGIPSRFLHFPDENHWILKPANSIQWHQTVLEWMNRWTGPGSTKWKP
jgi:dipeptidyl aminopeptidase/acylaminoacyl peptidase